MLVNQAVGHPSTTPTPTWAPEERLGLENLEKTSRRVAEIRRDPLAKWFLVIQFVTFLGWWKRDPFKGESWPPTIGDQEVTGLDFFKEVTADQVSNVGSFVLAIFFSSCHHFLLSSLWTATRHGRRLKILDVQMFKINSSVNLRNVLQNLRVLLVPSKYLWKTKTNVQKGVQGHFVVDRFFLHFLGGDFSAPEN